MAVAGSPLKADAKARREVPPSMVERVTLIMDTFDGRNSRRTLEDVTVLTRLPRSTAHRILDQLVRLGWLAHTSAGYELGRRALNLAERDGGNSELREAAASLLHSLQTRTGMVVHLAVLDGAEVYYLDKIGGPFAASVPSRVGGRAPAHSTALGKSMLAWLAPEEVDRLLHNKIGRMTPRTIIELETMHQELRRIRERKGLAFEREECFPGISCVAAAVRGREAPLGAISLVGDANTPLERVAPLVASAAQRVSQLLCSEPQERQGQQRKASNGMCTPVEPAWSPQTLDRLVASGQNGSWF